MGWDNAGEIDQALKQAGLPVEDVSFRVEKAFETQHAASFIRCGEELHKVGWHRRPTDEEKQRAASIVSQGCDPPCHAPEVIDSAATTYPADQPPPAPRKIAEVVA